MGDVKAKIALNKSPTIQEDFIQGYCNKGKRPELRLTSFPLKQEIVFKG